MNTTPLIEADHRPANRSAAAPAVQPAAAGTERPAPTCECPEYCLLDHSN